MSKIGAHVHQGPRNGYGEFCDAKPAVVLAVNEGGSLLEAQQRSGGHSWTIFRDTTIYLDAPAGMDQATPAQARGMADSLWPRLASKWAQNPADFYTVLNEPAGNDAAVLPSYLAYERRCMELAEQAGVKLCVLNLAGGTPASLERWKNEYVPHIGRAFQGGHIYGRHAYGGDLYPPDGNTGRPFVEAAHLRSVGLSGGGLAITELGFNGGYGYVGDQHFIDQAVAYEGLMRQHSNIIGGCFWTLGNWQGANWQTAISRLAPWMAANPTPKWQPGQVTPPPDPIPPPSGGLDEFLYQEGLAEQLANGLRIYPQAALNVAIEAAGLRPVTNEAKRTYAGQTYTIQVAESLSQAERWTYVWQPGVPVRRIAG